MKFIFVLRTAVSEIRVDVQFFFVNYWGLKLGAKVSEVAHVLSFYPGERGKGEGKIQLIFALRPAISEIRAHFQNGHIIFGHETWSLTKDPKVAHILSFYPKGSKLNLISLYG